jgi:polyphosphate kinase
MHRPDVSNKRKTTEMSRPNQQNRDGRGKKPSAAENNHGPACATPALSDAALFINREISQLAFQCRVLEEARDEHTPLLERFKFLSIVGSNLEEFFMVRVAGLKRQIESSSFVTGPDGLTPREQLDAINSEVVKLLGDAQEILSTSMMPALNQADIIILDYPDLSPEQKAEVDDYFLHVIFPVLTPLAFDPGHPFPHISNLSLNLAVLIRDPRGEERFARVKIPDTLNQLVPILTAPPMAPQPNDAQGLPPRKPTFYIWLDELVRANLEALFPGMTILDAHTFHVTRDADVEIQEWEADDLLEATEEGVRLRRFGDVVRLQVNNGMPADIVEILMSNLQVESYDVYLVDGQRPLSILKAIAAIDRHDLKYPPFVPAIPIELNPDEQESDSFAAISKRDILLHHPYESFQPVVNFLNLAAKDPNVLAIKMTLYRVGKNSPVVEALLRAIENRKQVAVLVELKARFDEESNIEWAKRLEREGAHVVYGLLGLKIHGKMALVVRKEGDKIKRYVHLGTGNYNSVTAHLYTDIGLFTCDEKIGADVTDVFNYLTGYSAKRNYRKLMVAPINLRDNIQKLIKREIDHQAAGRQGHIILKINALVDEQLIVMLYEASKAGVKIDLLVRGICCLRPGIPGISENIRVISILGRFLEHSRVYFFENGGKPEIFCGSADLMPRNLDRRVEVLFPVDDPRLSRQIREVLTAYINERFNAWQMQSDGSYQLIRSAHLDPIELAAAQAIAQSARL